jgi:hypothetical protein
VVFIEDRRITILHMGIQMIFLIGNERQSSCYMHAHSQNEWTLFGNLNTSRSSHASALLNGDLWMTGGYNRDVKL